ncbi:MAG: domain of cyanobacterial aminoacyl-tRNA synthetase [Moraxellaceae bacterium]|jgi:uncharacterized protein|nr:domain of cyanobacterial aminoacyl-tRNA synthetase [Moraxellaceae bacterium]
MGKLLQLIMLGVVAWFVFRYLLRKPGLPGQDKAPPPAGAGPAGAVMRRCDFCQVHVPEGESTQSRGHYFCSEAHRDAFFRGQR